MSYPYQYPPPGQPGAPYVPPPQHSPNGYTPNGYPVQHAAPQMPMQYVNSQRVQNQPAVVIPQRSSQQYSQYQTPNRPSHQYLSQPHASAPDLSIKVQPRSQFTPHQRPHQTPQPQQHTSHRPQQQQSPGLQQTLQRPQNIVRRQQDGGQRDQYTPQRQQEAVQQHRQPLPQHQQTPRPQLPTPRPPQQTSRLQQQTPRPQQQVSRPGQIRHPQVVIPSPSRSQATASTPRPSPSPSGATDYNPMLLLLAEEYIAAAHGMGPVVALGNRPSDQTRYYKLMATGMGCMKAVLKNYRLHPATECQLRLRYATLLHDETENSLEADEVLSQGINTCQRHRLLDLKYSMQHLQARVLAKTNPKAAMKSLDKAIEEAEDLKHISWVYALRFLCVSLSQQTPSHSNTLAALRHLEAISELSDEHNDPAVYVACAAFKVLLHLQAPGPESMMEAQRALADARKYQLDQSVQEQAQIMKLVTVLDLVCCIQSYGRQHARDKMVAMHAVLDRPDPSDQSKDEGCFGVPIDSGFGQLHASTGGIFKQTANGKDQLVFSWVHRRDLYCLGYYISGVATSLHMENKSMFFLQEGIKLIRESLHQHEKHSQSVPGMSALLKWRTLLDWHLRLQLAFHSCSRAEWEEARTSLFSLEKTASDPNLGDGTHRSRLVTYLSGTIDQGEGQLDSALKTYLSPILALPEKNLKNDADTDIAILAALNALLIIRVPSHHQHFRFELLMAQLEPLCHYHPCKDIVSAFLLIKGCADNGRTVDSTNSIRTSLNVARAAANNQLMTMSMNAFTLRYAGSLDAQAVKAHDACQKTAVRSKSKLWECTADGMLATLYEQQGNSQDAALVRMEIERLREHLPEDLRGE